MPSVFGGIFFQKKLVSFIKSCNFATTITKGIAKRSCNKKDPVVQLVRMPPCHGGGRGFESRPDRKRFTILS